MAWRLNLQAIGREISHKNPKASVNHIEGRGLNQKLQKNDLTFGPDGLPQSNLSGSFGDGAGHGVHNADFADEQSNDGNVPRNYPGSQN